MEREDRRDVDLSWLLFGPIDPQVIEPKVDEDLPLAAA